MSTHQIQFQPSISIPGNMKFTHGIAVAFLMSGGLALAQPSSLEPLESWERVRPNWASDQSEVAYLASRCGVLYGAVGAVFRNSGRTADDKAQGTDVTGRGFQLIMLGNELAQEAGWSQENLTQRIRSISDSYLQVISSNRTVHNNMFHGFVGKDWTICTDFEKTLRAVASSINRK
ncbi:MAG: hypothetical protein ACOYLF_14455 [Blastocatellia bacterium]